MPLILAGIGINPPKSLPLEILEEVKDCENLFLEVFTNPIKREDIEELKRVLGKEIKILTRKDVEDGHEILKLSKVNKVILLSYGDPTVATTHSQLIVRAKKENIETKIIFSSSILSSLFGSLGLHIYKMGKWVSITSNPFSTLSAYMTIYSNLLNNLHSPILLEYDQEKDFFLDPKEALKGLREREEEYKMNVILEDTLIIIVSNLGRRNQRITIDNFREILNLDFGEPPHTILIPSSLHFTEEEFLKKVLKVKEDILVDNSSRVKNRSLSMVEKYFKKTKRALERAREIVIKENLKGLDSLLENSEIYAMDSLRFLREGKYELAILSIAYAEGLLDSLRFLNVRGFDRLWEGL